MECRCISKRILKGGLVVSGSDVQKVQHQLTSEPITVKHPYKFAFKTKMPPLTNSLYIKQGEICTY